MMEGRTSGPLVATPNTHRSDCAKHKGGHCDPLVLCDVVGRCHERARRILPSHPSMIATWEKNEGRWFAALKFFSGAPLGNVELTRRQCNVSQRQRASL